MITKNMIVTMDGWKYLVTDTWTSFGTPMAAIMALDSRLAFAPVQYVKAADLEESPR